MVGVLRRSSCHRGVQPGATCADRLDRHALRGSSDAVVVTADTQRDPSIVDLAPGWYRLVAGGTGIGVGGQPPKLVAGLGDPLPGRPAFLATPGRASGRRPRAAGGAGDSDSVARSTLARAQHGLGGGGSSRVAARGFHRPARSACRAHDPRLRRPDCHGPTPSADKTPIAGDGRGRGGAGHPRSGIGKCLAAPAASRPRCCSPARGGRAVHGGRYRGIPPTRTRQRTDTSAT